MTNDRIRVSAAIIYRPASRFPSCPRCHWLPARVDADQWLHAYHGHTFAHKVKATGQVMVADTPYYVKVALAKQQVALRVDADLGQFVVEADGQEVQRRAIKGLGLGRLPFTTFVEHLAVEARTRRSLAYARMGQQRLQ